MSAAVEVRAARLEDAAALPAIEQSAGELFRTDAELAWLADGENLSEARYQAIIADGCSWVAVWRGAVVGFVAATREGDEAHIWELDVARRHQGQGIGRGLLRRFIAQARDLELRAVTLTTFQDLAWNAPFYRSMGFERLAPHDLDARLAAQLATEAAGGLPVERRCAMRLPLAERPRGC